MKKISVSIITLFFFLYFISPAFALPEGWQVESGNASFEQPDTSTLKINAEDKAVINFNSFNISQNESVNFIQPSVSATVLSRVIGPGASRIDGSLTANGVLFLTNPNGIEFGPSANVQVNSMIASTLDISTNNFINGNYVFEKGKDSLYAQILNEGTISGNNIALLASSVKNSGIIQAKAGTVHLASGDKTTVTIDRRGLIQVEVDSETRAKVYDSNGVAIKDAVANSGTIEAAQVFMSAKTAQDIFENAVNQSGIVKATGIVEENGVIKIKANRNIAVSGTIESPASQLPSPGSIEITSEDFIAVKSEFKTKGNTKLASNDDILVNADVTTDSGNLEFLADNDFNGKGAFQQAKGTFISTVNYGDIIIQSSGESALANINSSGDLILKQAGAPAIFNQWPDSQIKTKGSVKINPGATLNANNTVYEIGKDWVNLGNFNPQISKVSLVSPQDSRVIGANIFYDFSITVPGKIVKFASEETQAIIGTLTLRGEYGKLLVLGSIDPPKQWKILPQGEIDIQYVLVGDSVNIRGPPLKGLHSDSSGNLINWDLDPLWTGNGINNNWSNPDNWDTGTVPTLNSAVTFDGTTGLNPDKDSIVDSEFQGVVSSLTLNGYTGTLTIARDLIVTGDVTIQSGTLTSSSTLTIGGNWTNLGGSFLAQSSTVVFTDATKPSLISGDNTFFNFTCVTPGKILSFEPDSTQTILGTWKIEGDRTGYVKLVSQNAPDRWKASPEGPIEITYAWVEYSHNLNPPDIVMTNSVNYQGNINWDADRYWVGDTNPAVWNDANHWSATDGGAGGAGVPTASDAVYFTANNLNSCNLDVDVSVASITNAGGYTGTLHAQGYNVAVSGDFRFDGGYLNLSSGTWTIGGGWDTSGVDIFNAYPPSSQGTGTVILTGTGNLITYSHAAFSQFYNLQIAAAGQTTTVNQTTAINKILTFGTGTVTGTGTLALNPQYTGAGLVNNGATITIANISYYGRMATISIAAGDYGSANINFNTFTAAVVTHNFAGNITTTGYLTLNTYTTCTSIIVNTQNYSLTAKGVVFGNSYALPTTLNLGSSTVDLGTTGIDMGSKGTSNTLNLNTATITCAGPWELVHGTGTITQNPGTSTVTFDASSGTQTLTSNSNNFYNLTHSGAGTLQLVDNLTLSNGGTLTNSAGTFDTETNSKSVTIGSSGTSSTLTFSGGTWEGDGGTGANQTITAYGSATFSGGTFKAGSQAITINNNFTLSGGTFTSTSGTLSVAGDWSDVGGTFTHNSGTIDFNSASNRTFTTLGSQTYNNLTHSGTGQLQLSIWQYRRLITIDHTKVTNVVDPSTTYANFPVLVSLSGLSNINTNGTDIRFTTSDGKTLLPREIESYSGGTLVAWVKLTLTKDASDSTDDTVYMYYGNSAATEPAANSTYGSQNVWSNNSYAGVWHSKDATTTTIADSTSNANTGTKRAVGEPVEADGKIGKAESFDGLNDYIRVLNNIGNDFTVEFWINSTQAFQVKNNTYEGTGIIWSDVSGYANDFIVGGTRSDTTDRLSFFTGGPSPTATSVNGTVDITTGSWVYCVATRVQSTGAMAIYVNAVADGTATGTTTILTANPSIDIGGNTLDGRYLNGSLDEVQISSTARSAEWIATEYANQNSPSTFATKGAEGSNALTVAGALTNSGAGSTFDCNGAAVTVTGLATVSGGTYSASTGTQTFNAGLTVSGGTFTGSSGTVDVNGNFTLSSGTFTQATSTLNVSGDFSISSGATFTKATGGQALTFDGTGSLTDSNATKQDLGAATIGGTTKTRTLASAVKLTNLTINSGDTLNAAGYALEVTGNYGNSGTFTHGNNTVTFSATSTGKTITSGASPFYNITFDGSGGGWSLQDNLTVSNILTIQNGTLNQGSYTVTAGKINQTGGTLATEGSPFTTTGDFTLNGTLNTGSSAVTINGNLTTTSGGTLQGTSPNLSVDGFIGTKNNPINTSITGTATINAGSMQDLVSVSINGTGNYSFKEPIPGFVIVNDKVMEQVGQQNFRASLIQGTSGLYQGFMPQPIAMPVLVIMPAVIPMPAPVLVPMPAPAMPVLPAITPAPVPVVLPPPIVPPPPPPVTVPPPPKPSFEGIIGTSVLPKPVILEAFKGVAATTQLPLPITFEGIRATSVLPKPITLENFTGITVSTKLPIPVTQETFVGTASRAILPEIIPKPSFEGAISGTLLPPKPLAPEIFIEVIPSTQLPQAVTKETFAGSISSAMLPQPPPKPSFEGIRSTSLVPQVVSSETFIGTTSQIILPQPVFKPTFEGITSTLTLSKPITAETFKGAEATSVLPRIVSPLIFEEVTGEAKVKVMFPGGARIIPTYGMGVPLGVEKPILEPRIKEEEKEK